MLTASVATMAGVLASCGGDSLSPKTPATINVAQNLTTTDVQQIIAQAVQEAQAQGKQATIAVTDRVGNVLAVYRMGANAATTPNPVEVISSTQPAPAAPGVPTNATPPLTPAVQGGLEGVELPPAGSTTTGSAIAGLAGLHVDDLAAIAKAVTASYLSTSGHAFTTRTASQIVQSHFNPGQVNQAAGPLFGVQFSSLSCSTSKTPTLTAGTTGDLQGFIQPFSAGGPTPGPHNTPLGLSADPGGIPLYKAGAVVGAVGVIADGFYSVDPFTVADPTTSSVFDVDEDIAFAGTVGFQAPSNITADKVTVGGLSLRFSNTTSVSQLKSNPATAPALTSLAATVGTLLSTTGYTAYTNAGVQTGTTYSQTSSGVVPDSTTATPNFPGQNDLFVFVDNNNVPRFPPIATQDGNAAGLTQNEVQTILLQTFLVAQNTRAQIRVPLGQAARVNISVMDTAGNILGMVASRDAPIFGADVSIQKGRTVQEFSNPGAAAFFSGLPNATYLTTYQGNGLTFASQAIAPHITTYQTFVGNPNALADGSIAYGDRSIGNLAREFYPDGIGGNGDDQNLNMGTGPSTTGLFTLNGFGSPFHDGIQLDVAINAILGHVLFVNGLGVTDPSPCTGYALTGTQANGSDLAGTQMVTTSPVANGLQIFAGGVPIYRGTTLIGAIGISGDGTQQDDQIAFLGLNNGSVALGGAAANAPINAPMAMRADTLAPGPTVNGNPPVFLNYVQCPTGSLLSDPNNQSPCNGL